MTILMVACLASVFTYWLYEKWLTWAILIGSALFDGLLYLWVGDVVVCYRCNAHYRGFQAGAGPRAVRADRSASAIGRSASAGNNFKSLAASRLAVFAKA